MLELLDRGLNGVTMYRLVLYYLIFLLGGAMLLSLAGVLAYDPFALLFSVGFLVAACALANWALAKVFSVPANSESAYISALILALIITPYQTPHDLWFLGWASVLAMASKYLITLGRKHLFNPVAFAVALTYLALNQSATWWVGDAPMLLLVLAGGLVLVRKIGRFDLVLSFLGATFAAGLAASYLKGDNVVTSLWQTLAYSPVLFFAFIILTEPLTTPPARGWRIAYGALVGVLFTPQLHVGSFYATPEIAILLGNVFAYVVSPKTRLSLTLKRKVRLAPDIYDFIFAPAAGFSFVPGQYMEWTLGHDVPDSRGNRRYFTLASSPTEREVRLGVKFYRKSSTFKQALLALDDEAEIVASQIAGDFILPRDPRQKCVLIAGGIGITPFRSMIQYLLDTRQRRPLILFYANRTAQEFVYQEVFDRARQAFNLKTVYTLTDPSRVPAGWTGRVGHLTAARIRADVPDFLDCVFYLSGPRAMVTAFRQSLRELSIPSARIKTDFFPGFA
jgi:ferredoxin-NADP reductase